VVTAARWVQANPGVTGKAQATPNGLRQCYARIVNAAAIKVLDPICYPSVRSAHSWFAEGIPSAACHSTSHAICSARLKGKRRNARQGKIDDVLAIWP
jgi:hypothetical protein